MNTHTGARATAGSVLVLALATSGAVVPSGATGSAGTVLAPAAVALWTCTNADHGNPDLTSLTLSPKVLDVRKHAQTLRIVATVTDDGGPGPASGIAQLLVQSLGVELHPAANGTWVGVWRVRPGAPPNRAPWCRSR